VDVGAHAGAWTFPLAKAVPSGIVYAFEALPYYATVLKKTARLLGAKNVQIINMAVTNECGKAEIAWLDPAGRRLTGLTHIHRGEEPVGATVSVAATTLDAMLARHAECVSLLKIDVEGAEMRVLDGASTVIEKSRPVIFCEAREDNLRQYGSSVDDLIQFAQRLSYNVSAFDGERFLPHVAVPGGAAPPNDLLFTPK
jgi:FkbM family methyltransferase